MFFTRSILAYTLLFAYACVYAESCWFCRKKFYRQLVDIPRRLQQQNDNGERRRRQTEEDRYENVFRVNCSRPLHPPVGPSLFCWTSCYSIAFNCMQLRKDSWSKSLNNILLIFSPSSSVPLQNQKNSTFNHHQWPPLVVDEETTIYYSNCNTVSLLVQPCKLLS